MIKILYLTITHSTLTNTVANLKMVYSSCVSILCGKFAYGSTAQSLSVKLEYFRFLPAFSFPKLVPQPYLLWRSYVHLNHSVVTLGEKRLGESSCINSLLLHPLTTWHNQKYYGKDYKLFKWSFLPKLTITILRCTQ